MSYVAAVELLGFIYDICWFDFVGEVAQQKQHNTKALNE